MFDKDKEEEHPVTALQRLVDVDGFGKCVTPKPFDPEKQFALACTCGNTHFRHAGYIEIAIPFVEAGGERKVTVSSQDVKVCTKCKKCYIWMDRQLYDVTDQIDLEAWEKTEVELHKATGPGGQC